MKATIAATLIDANQNSNSPKARTEIRLVAGQQRASGPAQEAQIGTPGSHSWMIAAPAAASTASTMTQKYQYSQPTVKRAQSPSAQPGVVGERAGARMRDRHLAEHPHHEDHEQRLRQDRRAPRPARSG